MLLLKGNLGFDVYPDTVKISFPRAGSCFWFDLKNDILKIYFIKK